VQSHLVSSLALEGSGLTDSTLYLAPAGTPGLSVRGSSEGLGLRANASAPMMLDDCEVPSGFRITQDGAGFQTIWGRSPWFEARCAHATRHTSRAVEDARQPTRMVAVEGATYSSERLGAREDLACDE
jgi:alkylation response protein AidB-like acyl-CoA dehydrogenase